MAGAIGADWRMEPSPKNSMWSPMLMAVAGNTKGIAEEASRCSCVMRSRAALRCERTLGCSGASLSKKVTCSPEL
ncbi:hypothetical protein D3C87_2150570 [compost metagenome]